ncbi:MAG TPA: FAD-dependent oxidoreductase, partial [Marmoricola sp.]|nr:FAD-dependent oxidoreductase [Marmoricola sp.]
MAPETSVPSPAGSSRREFLIRTGVVAGAAGTATVTGGSAWASTRRSKRRVVVLGGGVGGLTTAHELAERGFAVTVVEPKAFGGKARSITIPHTGRAGRNDLPGEHGFRFFPGFYKNIPDTFRRIPVPGNSHGVLDHLVNASQELLTLPDQGQLWVTPTPSSDGIEEGARTLATAIGIGAGVPANEVEYFVRKLLVFLTSSDARRVGEWEYVPWTKFTNSENFSKEYQTVFGTGLTKDLVAAKGAQASTRTVGLMGEAFVYASLAQNSPQLQQESGYGAADRLLNLPTNEAWINPWIAHLKTLGVRFISGYRAAHIAMRSNTITGVTLRPTDGNGD